MLILCLSLSLSLSLSASLPSSLPPSLPPFLSLTPSLFLPLSLCGVLVAVLVLVRLTTSPRRWTRRSAPPVRTVVATHCTSADPSPMLRNEIYKILNHLSPRRIPPELSGALRRDAAPSLCARAPCSSEIKRSRKKIFKNQHWQRVARRAGRRERKSWAELVLLVRPVLVRQSRAL